MESVTPRRTLGQLFRLLAPEAIATQRECANELNVDPSVINRWCQGLSVPSAYNLQRVTAFLRKRGIRISADDIDLGPALAKHIRPEPTVAE